MYKSVSARKVNLLLKNSVFPKYFALIVSSDGYLFSFLFSLFSFLFIIKNFPTVAKVVDRFHSSRGVERRHDPANGVVKTRQIQLLIPEHHKLLHELLIRQNHFHLHAKLLRHGWEVTGTDHDGHRTDQLSLGAEKRHHHTNKSVQMKSDEIHCSFSFSKRVQNTPQGNTPQENTPQQNTPQQNTPQRNTPQGNTPQEKCDARKYSATKYSTRKTLHNKTLHKENTPQEKYSATKYSATKYSARKMRRKCFTTERNGMLGW